MALSLAYGLGLMYMLTAPTSSYQVERAPPTTTTKYSTTPPPSPLPSQDLTGRMFSMMSGSVVTLRGSSRYQDTYAFTVCLRIVTEIQRVRTIFSLMMDNSATLSLSKPGYVGARGFDLVVGSELKTLNPVSAVPSFGKLWPWTSLCVTWESNTGMTQWWRDEQMSERKGMWRGQRFSGTPVMTLSKFEGQVTDIHMWDEVLPFSTLRSYIRGWGFPSGNMLNWRNMSYTSEGYAVLENAYESQRESAEEDGTRKQQQRHSWNCSSRGSRQQRRRKLQKFSGKRHTI